jgi:hypothetical protein
MDIETLKMYVQLSFKVTGTTQQTMQRYIPVNILTFMGPCIAIIILIYIQRDATLHSLFYPETALHVLGGTSTHLQECKQLYLQHLVLVTPLLLSASIVEELELD